MKRISFNPRFVNAAGTDLVKGKIHTIRRNYFYWKKFEGRDLELFDWEGTAYRSRQMVFCVKRLVSVQITVFDKARKRFWIARCPYGKSDYLENKKIAHNDGFNSVDEFTDWFKDYPIGIMAILHFTDFRY
jgi:hypothetical protein